MKIVFGDELNESGARRLEQWREAFPRVNFVAAASPAEKLTAAPDADAWIGWVTREAFVAAQPTLKWVHSTSAGIEQYTAIRELVESSVTLTNSRGAHAATIAEHTFALLLALTRAMPALFDNQRARVWNSPGLGGGMREIAGATMLIVGFGNIGRMIARRAHGFDMRVIGADVQPYPAPHGVERIAPMDELDGLLPNADVVVIATPITDATRNSFGAQRIAKMKRGAYLLVVSRGGIVDEAAMLQALAEGRLAGAGLDVQAAEPLPADSPLWDAPNVVITPHSSPTSAQTHERVWAIAEENVRRFVNGQALTNVCDKRAGF